MTLSKELALLDATAQADLGRKREVKPIELVDAAIERIETVNHQINAVVNSMYDEARDAANKPLPQGPFTGVPFLLKDLLAAYAGVRMTAGSAFLRDFVPTHDSELVARYKRAGLIIVGKTNTPEFGIMPTTEPALFGPSRNPWDITKATGGSSGGTAAAVASLMVPFAHGNDGGGSIRIPASCCGLFGLKPTRARNPLGPDFGDMFSGLVAEHALTRSVRDSAALLDATSGPDVGDPYWAPPPARPFLQEVGANPGRLRIAFTTTAPSGVQIHPDCVAAVNDAVRLCVELGHEVVEASPKLDGELMAPMFMTIWSAGCTWTIDGAAYGLKKQPSADQFEPGTWALYQMGQKQSGASYMTALTWIQAASREVARFMLDYDVWLTPTLGEPPLPLGTFDSPAERPMAGLARSVQFVPFTPVCNMTGQPAMSVPLFWNKDGLPVGTHFVARFGDEAMLYRLAAQLEEARPWANRLPAVNAA
jgi:amidase